uniref:Odorant-binding protein 3 n=1 Tax=Adelphocoris suturalis TaxID=323751 RepID=A0A166IG64_9HEMI|nr:odorant-binding protein 3 [Adelphocoris suturalis]
MATNAKAVLFLALCGIVYVSAYQEVLKATISDCKGGKEVSQEELDEFIKPLIPQTREEKCLMACVFTAYNVIVEGHFDPKLAYGVAKNILHENPEKLKHIKETLDYCGHEIPTKMDDECELASEVMACRNKYNKDHGYDQDP